MNRQGNGYVAKSGAFDRQRKMTPSQPRAGVHHRSAPLSMDDVGSIGFAESGRQYQPNPYGASPEGRYPGFAGPELAMPGVMEMANPEPPTNRAGRMDYAEHPGDMNAVEGSPIDIDTEEHYDPVEHRLESLNLRLKLLDKDMVEVQRNQKHQIQILGDVQKSIEQLTRMTQERSHN